MGRARSRLRVLRYVATGHQHCDLNSHIPIVVIIQNTQNRDSKAIQLKLDELLRGVKGARTGMVRLEDLTDEELKRLTTDFEQLRDRHARPGQGVTQNDRPEPEDDTMERRVQD
jgi:hypothetical protein